MNVLSLLAHASVGFPVLSCLCNATRLTDNETAKYASTGFIFLAFLCRCVHFYAPQGHTSSILHDPTLPVLLLLISFLVHLYSTAYKKEKKNNRKYYGFLGAFTAAMMGLLTTDHLFVLLGCWEWMALSSYFLIGFYSEKKSNRRAALYGFLMNKAGSMGLWGGMMALAAAADSLSINELQGIAWAKQSHSWLGVVQVGILLGALTKSAQFPFHSWLLAAMRGPTPVSALLHSATMVAAGIFVLCRLEAVLLSETKVWMSAFGGLTLVLGSVGALFERTPKKILAYSTLANLGLMMCVAGAGHPRIALFCMASHAVAKACLFLFVGWRQDSEPQRTKSSFSGARELLSNGAYFLCVGSLLGMPFTTRLFRKEPHLHHFLSRSSSMALVFSCNLPGLRGAVLGADHLPPFCRRRQGARPKNASHTCAAPTYMDAGCCEYSVALCARRRRFLCRYACFLAVSKPHRVPDRPCSHRNFLPCCGDNGSSERERGPSSIQDSAQSLKKLTGGHFRCCLGPLTSCIRTICRGGSLGCAGRQKIWKREYKALPKGAPMD